MRVGKLVVFTVMTGPHADRFAVVTDRVVQVISRFSGRFLVTGNVLSSLPMPADLLRQQPAYGMRLLDAHEAAIEVLATREVRPDALESYADAREAADALEARVARFLSDDRSGNTLRRLARRGIDRRPIADDARSRRRIDAWLRAEAG